MGKPGQRFRMRELTILSSVIVAIAFFSWCNPRFFSVDNALAILESSSSDGLIVIGMTVIIVSGAFDMSVGSSLALCGLAAALVLKSGISDRQWVVVPLAVLAGLATGTFVGWINGVLVTRIKINPFITTLGTMSILRGAVQVVTRSNSPSGFPNGFYQIAWGSLGTFHGTYHDPIRGAVEKTYDVRLPIVILIAGVILADFCMRRMRYLRQVYFVGSNEEAARLTGINTARVKTFAFMLTGFLTGVTGIILASRANYVDANVGTGAELRVIAAVIVGGASLSGGRGTILGSFLGLLLMQIITNGLVFIGIAAEAQLIAVGLVLILASVIDQAGSLFSGRRLIALLTKTRNKKMERVINVVLVTLLIGVFLARLTGSREEQQPVAVTGDKSGQNYVMISFVTGGPYWIDSKMGLADKAKELGVNAVFTGPPVIDPNQQIDEINRAIAKKVDGIILVPISDAVIPSINQAIAAGIPVICADGDAPKSNRYCYVGTGNFNAGYQGGEQLAKLIGGRGEVALMYIPGSLNLQERVEGYKKALAKYPDVTIVAVGNDHGSQSEAEKECLALLKTYPNLKGFGCVAAIGGQGAAVAVKQAGTVGKVKIVAMDRDEATLLFIKEGVIDASIAQRTYMMPYLALQMLYDLRNDRIRFTDDWRKLGINPLPKEVDTGTFLITKDNVDAFVRNK